MLCGTASHLVRVVVRVEGKGLGLRSVHQSVAGLAHGALVVLVPGMFDGQVVHIIQSLAIILLAIISQMIIALFHF